GFGWTTAGLVGSALAPTDPAVMFSVLGKREIGGRTGALLEGESGANDPVGIALMVGMIELATHPSATFWTVVREFAVEMSIGLADLSPGPVWLDGIVLALLLAFVARPVVVGTLLWRARLRLGERLFVMWGGLKGAVPILLATFVLLANVAEGRRIYDIVFVV